MATVTVVYHFEDGSWWAEAAAVPGFVAGAASFDQARVLAQDGLAFTLDVDSVELDERFDEPAMQARRGIVSLSVSGSAAGAVRVSAGAAETAAAPRADMAWSVPQPASLRDPGRRVASSAA